MARGNSQRSSWPRRWLGRLSLLIAGLLISLILAEGGARLLDPQGAADLLFNAPDNAPQGLYTNDHQVGWVPTPGFDGVQSSLGYRVRLRVNPHSLRGPPVGPKTRPRWMAGGDSFTFAAQVDEADSFAQRLARQLDIEVLNAGADGYGTAQAAIRYATLDPELDLDGLVLTFFLGNDLLDNQRWPQTLRGARSRPEDVQIGALPMPFPWNVLSRNSYLFGRWRVAQRRAWMQRPDNPETQRWARELAIFTRSGGAELSQLLRQSEPAIDELRRAVGSDHLLVALAPPAFVVDAWRREATFSLVGLDPAQADPLAPGRGVAQLLASRGIATCDLEPALSQAQATGEKLYFDYDGHWTRAGHAVVAQALAHCITEQGW